MSLNAALVNIPIGVENNHQGVIDLITKEAVFFEGANGYVRNTPFSIFSQFFFSFREKIIRGEIPAEYTKQAAQWRQTMLERLADGDDVIAEKVN